MTSFLKLVFASGDTPAAGLGATSFPHQIYQQYGTQGNHTDVSEFFLMRLTEDPELKITFFKLFLFMYLVTVLGNLLIVPVCHLWLPPSHPHVLLPLPSVLYRHLFKHNHDPKDPSEHPSTESEHPLFYRLHHPDLLCPDFCLLERSFLLLVMAYDRYVAICHPMRYTVIMNPHLCVQLILLSLFVSIADALLHSLMVLRLSFCTDLEIPLFFCEVVQVIKLACSDTLINNILIYFVASLFAGVPLFGIVSLIFKLFPPFENAIIRQKV